MTKQPTPDQTHTTRRTGEDMGNSWATTVTQYILQRRAQTAHAYQPQLLPQDDLIAKDAHQNWLFAVLFEALVQRLEEGHTVITLTADDTHEATADDAINWQQQLLQLLLPTLQPAFTTLISPTDSSILADRPAWEAMLQRFEGSQYQRAILIQRYEAMAQLYQYLVNRYRYHRNLTPDSQQQIMINSLSNFIDLIKKTILFQENKNIAQENSAPIVFSISNHTLTLWLHRTWQAEFALAKNITRIKAQSIETLPIQVNPLLNDEQKNAIIMANKNAFSIITGGPGTGKTFTVAQLVIALQQASLAQKSRAVLPREGVNLALAAPTGKAAQRMQESLQSAITQAGLDIQLPEAKTIHRLLGITQGGQPRYDSSNPLGEDIVIVDEASMLGVELATHLVSAIKPNARLILLGDANQLAAVDAGAVLADLCRIPLLQDVHQRLTISRRFRDDSGIGKLAQLTNANHTDMRQLWQLIEQDEALSFYALDRHQTSNVTKENHNNQDIADNNIKNSLSKNKFYKKNLQNYKSYFNLTKKTLTKNKTEKSVPTKDIFTHLITELNQFKILTASHNGNCGDHALNEYLSHEHRQYLKQPLSKSAWYHGRPIMVLQNNYELGLFNGDIGICIQDDIGQLQVFFESKVQGIATHMLSDDMVATAYAMTIHKSQGSEFDHVAICFDDSNARLLSQELIYTAITRAKKQVSIFSTPSALTRALNTPTVRQTGLGLQFESDEVDPSAAENNNA